MVAANNRHYHWSSHQRQLTSSELYTELSGINVTASSAPSPKDLLTTLIRSYAAAIKSNDQLLVDYASRNLDAHLSRIDITLVEVQDIDANEDGAVGHA